MKMLWHKLERDTGKPSCVGCHKLEVRVSCSFMVDLAIHTLRNNSVQVTILTYVAHNVTVMRNSRYDVLP